MSKRGYGKATAIECGYGEIEFSKWQHFVSFINDGMLMAPNMIWRGQRRDDWELQSTLGRVMRGLRGSAAMYPSSFMNDHLRRFKRACLGRRGHNPKNFSDSEWWALGQHHGLATPLLDWTRSPFTAAYFAYVGVADSGEKQSKYRAIYALDRYNIFGAALRKMRGMIAIAQEEHQKLIDIGRADPGSGFDASNFSPEVAFIEPEMDENRRLLSQGGLFSQVPFQETMDGWVKRNFASNETEPSLVKIRVPDRDREEALRMLNRMNINHATMFPDLDGAATFCNTALAINGY